MTATFWTIVCINDIWESFECHTVHFVLLFHNFFLHSLPQQISLGCGKLCDIRFERGNWFWPSTLINNPDGLLLFFFLSFLFKKTSSVTPKKLMMQQCCFALTNASQFNNSYFSCFCYIASSHKYSSGIYVTLWDKVCVLMFLTVLFLFLLFFIFSKDSHL